jgi:DNA-binding NtrC family response regulator
MKTRAFEASATGGGAGSGPATTDSKTRADGLHTPRRLRRGLVTLFPRPPEGAPAAWRLSQPTSLGRDSEAEVRLEDGSVSRTHAMLDPRPSGVFVRDLDSRHGSFVNGSRVGPGGALAGMGSVLRFGDTLLLAVDDVERHQAAPRVIEGVTLGLPKTVVAGPLLAEVWDQAVRIASLAEPVLILGETGSGKECVARLIHAHAPRPGPFVGINVAAVPDTLFEAELFGYEKGAFTGACGARAGAFAEASGGVLFLDEIGDLKIELQAKLLRALDLGQIRRLGASQDLAVSARVVSATSCDLEDCVAHGRFRADLRYRLAALVIRVPPLRARRDDIVLLTMQLVGAMTPPLTVEADAMELLLLAEWEGNARQLRHVLVMAADQARAAGADELRPEHLPPLARPRDADEGLTEPAIHAALMKTGGVTLRAAKLLGVSRTTLYKAMARLGMERKEPPRG